MTLNIILERKLFSSRTLPVVVDGVFYGELRGGRTLTLSLPEKERYYIHIGERLTSQTTVLIAEGGQMTLTVTSAKKTFSLKLEGGRLEVLSMRRIYDALSDESALMLLSPWEKTAYYALLYTQLNRQDAILEDTAVLLIRDALFTIGDTTVAQRLDKAISVCELALPLDPMKRLTPEEESAIVESYHVLWCDEEHAPEGEEARSYVILMDYIYQNERSATDAADA